MAMVYIISKTVVYIVDFGKITNVTVMVFKFVLMVPKYKEFGKMESLLYDTFVIILCKAFKYKEHLKNLRSAI